MDASRRPPASSESVRMRMEAQRRRDTKPEVSLRRALFAAGLRFRVAYPVPGLPRRSIDIAFPRQRVAVFVDGCFWHSCPQHGVSPKSSSDWWRSKLHQNTIRDAETNAHLVARGWSVVRVWEHEPIERAASTIIALVKPATGSSGREGLSSPM